MLVGYSTGDDAGVVRLSSEMAVVQTVDLFPPITDDPYEFGLIAASNALSDIYAMGARPISALSIVLFPLARLKLEVLREILRGAQDKAREAGIDIIGGHSIDDHEPKFGLVVTGVVHPERIWRNVGMRVGDLLVLTKPLGTGILSTALKRGLLAREEATRAGQTMAALNRLPAEVLAEFEVHACTDVTGFGLLGHLREMAGGGRLRVRIDFDAVPLLPQTLELAGRGVVPGGSRRNLAHVRGLPGFSATRGEPELLVLADAQTSGGLLAALPPDQAPRFIETLMVRGHALEAAIVGEVQDAGPPDPHGAGGELQVV